MEPRYKIVNSASGISKFGFEKVKKKRRNSNEKNS